MRCPDASTVVVSPIDDSPHQNSRAVSLNPANGFPWCFLLVFSIAYPVTFLMEPLLSPNTLYCPFAIFTIPTKTIIGAHDVFVFELVNILLIPVSH